MGSLLRFSSRGSRRRSHPLWRAPRLALIHPFRPCPFIRTKVQSYNCTFFLKEFLASARRFSYAKCVKMFADRKTRTCFIVAREPRRLPRGDENSTLASTVDAKFAFINASRALKSLALTARRPHPDCSPPALEISDPGLPCRANRFLTRRALRVFLDNRETAVRSISNRHTLKIEFARNFRSCNESADPNRHIKPCDDLLSPLAPAAESCLGKDHRVRTFNPAFLTSLL